MKRLSLSALVLLLSCTAAFSQRIMKVEKTDGTIVDYPVKDVKRVFFEGEELANLVISTKTISLKVGETSTVVITEGSNNYAIVSNKTSVATAVLNGSTITINAIAAGTAIITVTDTQSEQTATIEVTVTTSDTPIAYTSCPDENHPHMIDLGIGTLWSCCNVGASAPEQYGNYYAWGETQPKSVYNWDTYQYYNGSLSYPDCYVNIGSDISGTQYDAARANWGAPWRMPTLAEIQTLLNRCTSVWTIVNGVYGRKFTGPNGGTIFLPAAGYRWADELGRAGSYGNYWSSALLESYPFNAFGLYFDSGGAYWSSDYYRGYGLSVRPVR